MQLIPPLDPKQYGLEQLMAACGRTVAWINTDDGNPHGEPNIARHTLHEASKVVPFHYRYAIPDHEQTRSWIDKLVAIARDAQQQRGNEIATVMRGPSLLLLGITGVGKTYLAYGAVRGLAVTGVASRFVVTTAADMYAALRPRHSIDSEAEFRRYRDARLLLVDDLGAERKPTDFTEEVNFRLINWRYEHHLPTLLTSNVRPKELAARLGDRVTSRLAEMCERVVLEGRDLRRGDAA